MPSHKSGEHLSPKFCHLVPALAARKCIYLSQPDVKLSFLLLTTRSVFGDPGVCFGGLSVDCCSARRRMEPSDYCDVNLPVDRSQTDFGLAAA